MQIKLVQGAALVLVTLLASGGVIAADQQNPGKGEVRARDSTQVPDADSTKAKRKVAVRNSRPRDDHHKDARACLKAGTNEAVIRCSRKYR